MLTHYFADKDEILLSALRSSHRRIVRAAARQARRRDRAGRAARAAPGQPAAGRRSGPRRRGLEIGFWSRSLTSPALLEAQRAEAAELRYLVRSLLGTAAEAGEITTAEDLDDVAERLLALVDGLSVHRLLYPDRLGAERLERLLGAELDRLRPISA